MDERTIQKNEQKYMFKEKIVPKKMNFLELSDNEICDLITDYFSEYYKDKIGIKRISNVLDWFEENYKKLIEVFREKIANGEICIVNPLKPDKMIDVFGFYLGGEYLNHIMGIPAGLQGVRVEINKYSENFYGGSETIEFAPFKDIDPKTRFFLSFNAGIHEYTHAIIIKPVLSEIATFYIQRHYGLFIKSKDITRENIVYSCRDLTQIKKEIGAGRIKVSYDDIANGEYLAFLIVPYIDGKYVKMENITEFTSSIFSRENTIKDIYLKRWINVDNFIKSSGIEDKELQVKLKHVFRLIKNKRWKNAKQFIEIFEKIMRYEFGKPIEIEDIPEGFAFNFRGKIRKIV